MGSAMNFEVLKPSICIGVTTIIKVELPKRSHRSKSKKTKSKSKSKPTSRSPFQVPRTVSPPCLPEGLILDVSVWSFLGLVHSISIQRAQKEGVNQSLSPSGPPSHPSHLLLLLPASISSCGFPLPFTFLLFTASRLEALLRCSKQTKCVVCFYLSG